MTLQAWKLPQLILKNRPTFRGLVQDHKKEEKKKDKANDKDDD